MRVSIVVFLFVIAGAYALPEQQIEPKNERIITNQIRRAIEQIRREIRAAGLDPLYIDRNDFEFSMSPFIRVEGLIDQLTFTGASNIVINQLSYNIFQNSVRFTLSIPELRLSINKSSVTVHMFGNEYNAELNGGLIIRQVRLAGDVRASLGIISGISIRSVSLQFSIGQIQSNLQLNALGNNYSDELNQFLGTTIPEILSKYRNEINRELSKIVLDILRQIM
ncbi:uncharacterized protein LOC125074417 [Vanessa atalanta]|uniref:uncharacterized protein LOC125074417 n=1 Tax=Vanessa atalanta TaxID=42275 RepID=UPI001FCCF45D|nr:uncharacterized protein LOC125074417 [Vanessa atalanta]